MRDAARYLRPLQQRRRELQVDGDPPLGEHVEGAPRGVDLPHGEEALRQRRELDGVGRDALLDGKVPDLLGGDDLLARDGDARRREYRREDARPPPPPQLVLLQALGLVPYARQTHSHDLEGLALQARLLGEARRDVHERVVADGDARVAQLVVQLREAPGGRRLYSFSCVLLQSIPVTLEAYSRSARRPPPRPTVPGERLQVPEALLSEQQQAGEPPARVLPLRARPRSRPRRPMARKQQDPAPDDAGATVAEPTDAAAENVPDEELESTARMSAVPDEDKTPGAGRGHHRPRTAGQQSLTLLTTYCSP